MIQLRGPHRHVSGHAHTAYSGYRWSELSNAIGARRRSLFEGAEWSSIPWSNREKSIRTKLLDVATPIPGLLEKADSKTVLSGNEVVALIQELCSARKRLYMWKATLDSQLSRYDRDSSLETGSNPEYFSLFGLDISHAMLNFWAFLIVVQSTINRLRARLPESHLAAMPSTNDADRDTCANSIFQCMGYSLSEEAGAAASQAVTLPIAVAAEYYASHPRTAGKLRSFIQTLCDPSKSGPSGPLIGAFIIAARGIQP